MRPDWPKLEDVELRYMAKVLEHTRGDVTRAARILGMELDTLVRIMSGEPNPEREELGGPLVVQTGALRKYLFQA